MDEAKKGPSYELREGEKLKGLLTAACSPRARGSEHTESDKDVYLFEGFADAGLCFGYLARTVDGDQAA